MELHIFNKSQTLEAFESSMRTVTPASQILLIQDAVLLLLCAESIKLLSDYKLYALEQDCKARGLSEKIPDTANLVDMDGFVELTEGQVTIVSW